MPTRHIALVPESGMNPTDLARVSAALQRQVTRDLGPIWHASATVDPFPSLEDVPAGYWPIIVTFRPHGGDAGIHVDKNGQPYALIEMSPSWSLTASHVCMEMITDPFASRSFPGASPRPDQGDVEFRGGICDPCEHPDAGYLINDVLVSDFCTPAFWDPSSRDQRSFTGAIQEAYQVLAGGHLCWHDPTRNTWWLRRFVDGVYTDVEVGVADPERGPIREFICRHSLHLQATKMSLEAFEARVGATHQRALRASHSRAYWLRASLEDGRAVRPLELDGKTRTDLRAERGRARSLEPHERPYDERWAVTQSWRPSQGVHPSVVAFKVGQDRAPAPSDEPTLTIDPSELEPSAIRREMPEARARETRGGSATGRSTSTIPAPNARAPVERPTEAARASTAPREAVWNAEASAIESRTRTLPLPSPAAVPTVPPATTSIYSDPPRAERYSAARGSIATAASSWAVLGVAAVALVAAVVIVQRRGDAVVAPSSLGSQPIGSVSARLPSPTSAPPAPVPTAFSEPAASATLAPAPEFVDSTNAALAGPVRPSSVTRAAGPEIAPAQAPAGASVPVKPRAPAAITLPLTTGAPTAGADEFGGRQ